MTSRNPTLITHESKSDLLHLIEGDRVKIFVKNNISRFMVYGLTAIKELSPESVLRLIEIPSPSRTNSFTTLYVWEREIRDCSFDNGIKYNFNSIKHTPILEDMPEFEKAKGLIDIIQNLKYYKWE